MASLIPKLHLEQHHGCLSSAFPFLGSACPPSTTRIHLVKGLRLATMIVEHDAVTDQR